jgi:hypothetical protein
VLGKIAGAAAEVFGVLMKKKSKQTPLAAHLKDGLVLNPPFPPEPPLWAQGGHGSGKERREKKGGS